MKVVTQTSIKITSELSIITPSKAVDLQRSECMPVLKLFDTISKEVISLDYINFIAQ